MFTYKLLALVGMLADSTFIFLPLWTHFDLVIIYLLFSAPATFERQFQRELPLLYKYLTEAPSGKVFLKLLCSNFIFFLEQAASIFFPTILFPCRFAGRMLFIGCGPFSQKIGDHGEMKTYIWVHVPLLLVVFSFFFSSFSKINLW